jgi:hypothetical protein
MEVQSTNLIEFIVQIDRYLTRKMNVIMVGGTALTLLGKKESTKDIDICFENKKDLEHFVKVAGTLGYSRNQNRLIGHGLIIDLYSEGYIFCVQLSQDYSEKAIRLKELEKITLFALSPEDIIITKTARLDERDLEDIKKIFDSFEIDKGKLISRYFSTMENSLVKDAKSNLLILVETLDFPEAVKQTILRWNNE